MTSPALLRLRPYRVGDHLAFIPRRDFAEERAATDWPWPSGIFPGIAWTLARWSGEICGVAGAVPEDEAAGRWQVWAQTADLRPRDWRQALWLAARALTMLERGRRATVIEALARVTNPAAQRCLAHLGFAETGHRIDARLPARGYVVMERAL